MKKSYLKYFLPVRCILFLVIFIAGAFITKQKVDDISNWWSIIASAVNIATILYFWSYQPKEREAATVNS